MKNLVPLSRWWRSRRGGNPAFASAPTDPLPPAAGPSTSSPTAYEFGVYRLDIRERRLTRSGEPVALTPKMHDLLAVLAASEGRAVDRDELMRTVWPDVNVTEANLTQTVWLLRKTLSQDDLSEDIIETVPRRGYRFRPPVVTVTPGGPASPPSAPAAQGPRLLWVTPVAILLLVLVVWLWSRDRSRPAPSPVSHRRSLAVLGFRDLGNDPRAAWLAVALSEMLATELAVTGELRTIPGDNVTRARADLALPFTDTLPREKLDAVRRTLAADLLLSGSYLQSAEGPTRLRVDIRIQEAASGETVVVATQSGLDALEVSANLGEQLRTRLGIGGLSAAQIVAARVSRPQSATAARFYSEGLGLLRRFDAQAALKVLEEAATAEPGFAPVHTALASAWLQLGYRARAQKESQTALERSTTASREERLKAEARSLAVGLQWAKAADVYKTLAAFFPDDLEHGLQLAFALRSSGKPRDALEALAGLRRLPSPASDDPRIDIEEARAAETLSDAKMQLAAATRAADKARSLGARQVLAHALIERAVALRAQGASDDAVQACREAERLFAEVGNRSGVADATTQIATIAALGGQLGEARKRFEEVLALRREIGDQAGVAIALNNLANVQRRLGDPAGALARYDEALSLFRQIENHRLVAATTHNRAHILKYQGRLLLAKDAYREALGLFREVGDRTNTASALASRAAVLRLLGRISEAQADAESAVALGRETADPKALVFPLCVLANVHLLAGDLRAARSAWEEAERVATNTKQLVRTEAALGLGRALWETGDYRRAQALVEPALAAREQAGDRGRGEARLLLASILIDGGNPGRAVDLARQTAGEFRQEGSPDEEAVADSLLALGLAVQGKMADARSTVSRAETSLRVSENRQARIEVALATARVALADGVPARAKQVLAAVQKEAAGVERYRIELELLLAQAEAGRNPQGSGTSRLASLQQEAAARGFLRLAGRAASPSP